MAKLLIRTICLGILIAAGCAGCAALLPRVGRGALNTDTSSQSGTQGAESPAPQTESGAAERQTSGVTPNQQESSRGTETGASASGMSATHAHDQGGPSPVSINLLIEELETEGLLTPQTKAQLVEDLCRTPPQLWPAIVDTFRATVELRKKRAASGAAGQIIEYPPSGVPGGDSASVTAPTSAGYFGSGSDFRQASSGSSAHPNSSPEDTKRPAVGAESAPLIQSGGQSQGGSAESVSRQENGLSQEDVKPASFRQSDLQAPAIGEASVTDMRVPVRSEASATDRPTSWTDYVKQAIEGIQKESPRRQPEEVRLRLLQLALSNRDAAVQPISGLSPALQEFWSETLFGLALLSDNELNSDPQLRLTEARRHLQAGLRRLSEECPLEVTGLAFVTAVQSWGVYDAFEKYEFTPGQKVLLYAEVENLSAESTPKGYRTAWRSSYQILDSSGKEIARYEYAPNEEYCRRPRRDFFIGCELSLPTEAAAGRYTLRLTVVDLIRNRVGQGTIEFSLRSKSAK